MSEDIDALLGTKSPSAGLSESGRSSVPRDPVSASFKLAKRYRDAYVVARTVTAFGATVKFLAFALTGIFTLIALVAGSQSMQYAVVGIVLSVAIGVPIYVLGILVSAQGQILKATLDHAVTGSPLLTHNEMRQIMSLD